MIEQQVTIPEPDQQACRRCYENNRRRFRAEDLLVAAHLLFLADPQDEDVTARAREQATAALARVLDDPGAFGDVAAELSACLSAAQGGNFGQIARGQTVPELETFLFDLEPGQICPVPVKTRFGYHVLRLDRRIERHELPFEAVRDRIAAHLCEHVWRCAVSQSLRLLIGQADIRGIELEGARSLLVQ